MKSTRAFRLLSQTTFIYLIFTFIAFFSSALFLTHEADKFIGKNLDSRFNKSGQKIQRHLEAGRPRNELSPGIQITDLGDSPRALAAPVYADTLIYNAEQDEMHRFRKKTAIIEANGRYYHVAMIKSVEDFRGLRDDIFGALIPAFALLALAIVAFNFFQSGYFFRPFNRILDVMKMYKVGQRIEVEKIATSTLEFRKMQDLFHQMMGRIESDYRNLKEYTENMAHEMQTPLAVIRNKSESLLVQEEVMRHHAETVKIIYDEANHLSKLGNTLNLLTKIENGEFGNAIEVATRPVIEKHIAAIEELARLKSLGIESDLVDQHRLLIDPFLLDIVLKNLLRNAISYGESPGPIRLQTTIDHLTISNYGAPLETPGERLFERFYRNNLKKNSLGLGLSLVKKICELNDLRIDYRYQDDQHLFRVSKTNNAHH
ncbi:MAG: histidine kinase dimerization/phospho-acceptor domain-containing protein [bacterium]